MTASTSKPTLSTEYDLLTVNEAAEIAQCTPQAIRAHIASGVIQTLKPCRDHLIPRDEFDAFMHRRTMNKAERISVMVDQFVELAPSLSADQRAKLAAAL